MTDLVPLVEEDALAAFLRREFGEDAELTVQRHQAGHSNETFFVTYGERDLVLRRPPRGAFLPTAHDVRREFEVMRALGPTGVRVPAVLMMCTDRSVIGAEFYLMERVRGAVVRDHLPDAFGASDLRRVGDELVDSLVELHAVDPGSCGLEDFGRRSGYLQRQLKRWNGQLELTLPHTRPLPALEEVGSWLADNTPGSQGTTIVHGDYKLDNVIFDPASPTRLTAILDWEMSTLGDPLADLGWMISFWREPGDEEEAVLGRLSRVTEMDGFSDRAALANRYQRVTGRDISALDWYVVLAIWKLSILLEGSFARHLAGMTDDPFFAELEHGVPALAERAIRVSEEGSAAR